MSQTDPTPADPHQEISRAAQEEQYKQSRKPIWQATPGEVWKAFGKLVVRITPWLFEFGSWIFGGLIAFTLLVMAALINVGPVDPAILVATAAFALALPLNVTGLILLRLIQDLKHVGFEEELAHAFEEVGFTFGEQYQPVTLGEVVENFDHVLQNFWRGAFQFVHTVMNSLHVATTPYLRTTCERSGS